MKVDILNNKLSKGLTIEKLFFKAICLIALIDFILLLADFNVFFGDKSIIPYELEMVGSLSFDYLHWVYLFASKTNTSLNVIFSIAAFLYGSLLLWGIYRSSYLIAFCILILQLFLYRSISHFNYGYDHFISISFFYVFIVGVFNKLAHKEAKGEETSISWLSLILRIHLCIVYFFNGIAKAIGEGWWNGNSMLRALATFENPISISPYILAALCIGVVVIETFYPVFIFTQLRKYVVWAVIVMHIGIGLLMQLPLFGLIMITWNVIAHADLFFPLYKKQYNKGIVHHNLIATEIA